eukprot:3310111-Alexandrium_andersonii.AAC.1
MQKLRTGLGECSPPRSGPCGRPGMPARASSKGEPAATALGWRAAPIANADGQSAERDKMHHRTLRPKMRHTKKCTP